MGVVFGLEAIIAARVRHRLLGGADAATDTGLVRPECSVAMESSSPRVGWAAARRTGRGLALRVATLAVEVLAT
jgi:hypothetical protein